MNFRVGWLVGEVHVEPLSYVGDVTAEPMLAVASSHCRVMSAWYR
jgi:hypothetical protein